jgi:hypothetical protein
VVVERRDLVDLGLRQAHFDRQRGEPGGGNMAPLVLDEMQKFDE